MRFVVYKDKAGEWRWRLIISANGKTLADSAEGYKRRGSAVKGCKRIKELAHIAYITDENNVAIA